MYDRPWIAAGLRSAPVACAPGKLMAMNSSRAAGLFEEADVGVSALARVPVLPPMPLLLARLEAPGLRAEAPAKVEGVSAAPWRSPEAVGRSTVPFCRNRHRRP